MVLFQFYNNKMKQTPCSKCQEKSHPPAVPKETLHIPCTVPIDALQQRGSCCRSLTLFPFPGNLRVWKWGLCSEFGVTLCQAWALPISLPPNQSQIRAPWGWFVPGGQWLLGQHLLEPGEGVWISSAQRLASGRAGTLSMLGTMVSAPV